MSDFFVRNIRENPIEDGINESDFLITINSNKVISTQAEFDLVQKQTQVMIEKDIGSREGLNDILKYLDDKGTIDNIGEVNIEYTTEIGHKMHRYHTHIFIKIKHTTKIHIDTLKLKELAKFYWSILDPAINPYINVKTLYTQKSLRDYITKNYDDFSWLYKEKINLE